jgi:hypothetical protein
MVRKTYLPEQIINKMRKARSNLSLVEEARKLGGQMVEILQEGN